MRATVVCAATFPCYSFCGVETRRLAMQFQFDPPRLSLEPDAVRRAGYAIGGARPGSQPRPTRVSSQVTVAGTSHFYPARASSAGGAGSSNFAAGGAAPSSSSLVPGSSSAAAVQPQQGAVVASQERLIQNLKQQVELLRSDLAAERSGRGVTGAVVGLDLPPAGSPATHAVVPLGNGRSPQRGASLEAAENGSAPLGRPLAIAPMSASQSMAAASNALARSAASGQLSSEVAQLRQRHAELERDYGAQIQQLRRSLEEAHTLLLEHDIIDPRSLSAAKLVRRNPNDARQRVAADERLRAHALEVVELQKELGRARSQVQLRDAELAAARKDKEVVVQDLVAAKDEGRAALGEVSILQRQLGELQRQLRAEQEQRHSLEDKLNALAAAGNAAASASAAASAAAAGTSAAPTAAEYESRLRQLTAQLSIAKCDADNARLAEQKWRSDIETIAAQNAELARAAEVARDRAAQTELALGDTRGRLEDCEAQREFLQLTVDRMRVDDTSVGARTTQLENMVRAERENQRELEKRYNRALEDNDSLMRALRQRDADQERRDADDTKVRAQAKVAIDTNDALRRENEQLRHAAADLTRRLETTADLQQLEKAVSAAAARLEAAKQEMASQLQRQAKLHQDMAAAVAAVPRPEDVQRVVQAQLERAQQQAAGAASQSSSSSSPQAAHR